MNTHIPNLVRFAKRVIDVIGALLGLSIMLFLCPFIALLIKSNSKGPVFFKQLRVGRQWTDRTDVFWMYKFRTMQVDPLAEKQALWVKKSDDRVTKIGKFLRRVRLDELPQFYNVLRGDMSLIGPRPERPIFIGKLESAIPFYQERVYGLAPGITGFAQVNLGYDEHIENVRQKVAYDHAYALILSKPLLWILTDIRILFLTLKVVFLGRGQ